MIVDSEPVMVSLKTLMGNTNYILVLHAFALVYGSFTSFCQEVALIITPFGFDSVLSYLMSIY